MSDVPLPFAIIQWMRDRNWGDHHLEWHTARQWDRLSPAERAEALSLGWQRATNQEGEAANGFEFLMMHRAMLHLLREEFPTQTAFFDGWSQPPTDPANPSDPVPMSNPQTFSAQMLAAIARLNTGLLSFPDDDALGLYVETRMRPVRGNPFATSSDLSAGIHNYLHNRFSDGTSPINMGDPSVNIENTQFWRLHGWIDARWTAFRAAKGLSDSDPAFQQALQRERHHLLGHMVPAMGRFGMPAAPRPPKEAVSASLRNPFGESLARRFQRLMAPAHEITTLDELKEYLQTAIQLEHATLPIYLTAMWSIKQPASQSGTAIRNIILKIVLQEMVHMGLASNLLKAIGGEPRINTPDAVVQFPDFLPGIELLEKVDLRPLSMDRVKLFMKIESPLDPIPPHILTALAVPRFPTIGEFYAAIDRGLTTVNPTFQEQGQLARNIRGDQITVIANLDQARQAIKLIQEQGEGLPASQGAADFGGGLAHYYQFEQIVEQMKYVPIAGTNRFKLDPQSPLPFPTDDEIYPMAPVPAGGYPGVVEAAAFDQSYSKMLSQLQRAWDHADSSALDEAVSTMFELRGAAVTLMKKIRPDGLGNYGPAFQLVSVLH